MVITVHAIGKPSLVCPITRAMESAGATFVTVDTVNRCQVARITCVLPDRSKVRLESSDLYHYIRALDIGQARGTTQITIGSTIVLTHIP